MFAQTFGSTTLGVHGVRINVEVDIANGLPGMEIVGLPDAAVRESRERVRSAIRNAGLEFPTRRITVNLAPADIKKDSSGLDLPIAVGVLAASGQVDCAACRRAMFVGELSLEGKIRGVNGLLPMAANCRRQGIETIYIAPDNVPEALLVDGLNVCGAAALAELVRSLNGEAVLPPPQKTAPAAAPIAGEDFSDVQGQFAAKRALEIAAAGGHNVLMIGPPGSGKTMLARRVNSILPALSNQEALEVTKIYSVAGLLPRHAGLVSTRPFRSPHHTISDAGMIGGGRIPRPGEVTLSHHGVLFLDELPEFAKSALEVLRQPLEDGRVAISRVNASIVYPARFMLIASMNPCPCGFAEDPDRPCSCTPSEIRRYVKKISGPLLDRIDIHMHVPRLEYGELNGRLPAEPSALIRGRVEAARHLQPGRLMKSGLFNNAQMGRRQLLATCSMTDAARRMLEQVFKKMNLSARSHDRIIKVARTIADLAAADVITDLHIAEAVQLRGGMQRIAE